MKIYKTTMNFSFNTNSSNSSQKNVIKSDIDKFKLAVDEDERYLINFEIFEEDSHFVCYVDDYEIAIKYENNKLIDVECLNDSDVTNGMRNHIDKTQSIYHNLISLNNYFYIFYHQNDDDENEKNNSHDGPVDSDEDSEKSNDKKKNTSSSKTAPVQRRSRLNKLIETDLEVAIRKSEMDSILESDDDSDLERVFEEDENVEKDIEYTKESKAVKFEVNLESKKFIIDLRDDIIINDNNDCDNYIPSKVIDASIKIGKASVVHQIVNELNNAIKQIKNINIKAVETVFNISVENIFKNYNFEYSINIPQNFPFAPPTLVIKPNYNQSFSYALNNCEILNATKWNPSTTIKDIIVGIFNNVEKFELKDIQNTITDSKFADANLKLLQITNTPPLNTINFILILTF